MWEKLDLGFLLCRRVSSRGGRRFASASGVVFDRDLKRLQKDVAAQRVDRTDFDYLRNEVSRRLVDRLQDIKRQFPLAVDLGCGNGHIARHINGFGGVETLVHMDSCAASIDQVRRDFGAKLDGGPALEYVVADEEMLPLAPASLDLVMSSLSLHWVNDLEGTLLHIRKALKPDGVFLGAFLGGKTLQELRYLKPTAMDALWKNSGEFLTLSRSAFAIADIERAGGLSPHISPMVSASDIAGLLQQAGFALPTVDNDFITSLYPDMFTLCEHLQGMGESNVSLARRPFVSRDVFTAAASAYEALYASDYDGLIPATFHIIYMIGWSPAQTQPKPKRRGSAQYSLKDLANETPNAPSSD